jgi:hypothetical protein
MGTLKYVAKKVAARRVHQAMCGPETITALTSQERRLVALDWLEALDRRLTDEWQAACNREELFQHQCNEAWDWFDRHGVAVVKSEDDVEFVDARRFEEAFARAFPSRDRQPEPPPERRRGRKSSLVDKVRAFLAERYPAGVPEQATYEALQAELKEAGIAASKDTISRALNRR